MSQPSNWLRTIEIHSVSKAWQGVRLPDRPSDIEYVIELRVVNRQFDWVYSNDWSLMTVLTFADKALAPFYGAGSRTIFLVHALYLVQICSLAKVIPGDLIEMRCSRNLGARELSKRVKVQSVYDFYNESDTNVEKRPYADDLYFEVLESIQGSL